MCNKMDIREYICSKYGPRFGIFFISELQILRQDLAYAQSFAKIGNKKKHQTII